MAASLLKTFLQNYLYTTLAHEGREDWGGVTETGEEYDLIVVGGGASANRAPR